MVPLTEVDDLFVEADAARGDHGRAALVDERPYVGGTAAWRDHDEIGVQRGDGSTAFLCALEAGAIDQGARRTRHTRGNRGIGTRVLEDAAGTRLMQRLRPFAKRE